MRIYVITSQGEDSISCHSLYTDEKKRDKNYDKLEKEERDVDSCIYYYKDTVVLNDQI